MTEPKRTRDQLIDLIEEVSQMSRYGYGSPLHKRLKIDAPYTFTTLAGELILPLNRLYKPLGFSEPWIEYSDHVNQAVAADSLNLAAVPIRPSRTHSTGHCEVYLYADSTAPWLSLSDKKRYLQVLSDVLSPASSQHPEH